MTTNAELKALTQEDIRDKTAPKSILKGKVADAIDAAYDYTDQQTFIKTDKVLITHAELLALSSSPKVLVPAVSDEFHYPLRWTIEYVNNTGWGNSGTPFLLNLGSTLAASISSQMGGATNIQQTGLALTSIVNTSSSLANQAITLGATSNPSSPNEVDSSAIVYITYITFKV